MHRESNHVSGEDLLLLLDGELRGRRKAGVRRHLEACRECRAYSWKMQSVIANFVDFQQERFEDVSPEADGRRALFRARLESIRSKPPVQIWPARSRPDWRLSALGFAVFAAVFVWVFFGSADSVSNVRDEPIRTLTPGETIAATEEHVCSSDFGRKEQTDVMPILRDRVFERYGMQRARYQDFEVDYLITPDLGGAASLRNLWPEPYGHTAWNAHVKDQLETRLHGLVCSHQLSLVTAQNEIASDWIGAYQRYFRTDRPISGGQPVSALFAILRLPGDS